MRNAPLPLIGQFYRDDDRPWSMQDVCNYLPAAAETEGTRTPVLCKTPPGLAPFVDTGSPSPLRGLYNAEGRLFGVVGGTLYQFSTAGVAIPIGPIGGVSRARFAHNQLTAGNEVLIVNGSSGYIYNTATTVLQAITDDGYPGGIDAVFLDGYFIQIEPARRYAFNSDLADGLSYNTLDRFTSEVAPDLLVGLAVSQNELILFSETTAEFFENTGAAQQPFRSKRISMERGAASRYGQAHMDNTVFWLGNDGKFYVLDGYAPRRISTRPIEQAIRGLNWAQAFAFVWESEGHAVVYWTFPDGQTWGYDASQGRWHRRASYGLNRWRVNATAFWQGEWIAGDFQAGKLWNIDWDYPWEGQTEFVSEVVAPVIHDHQNRVVMPRLEVLMDTGMPAITPRDFPAQPDGPAISGDAPSGSVGAAYSFAYTVTPGDAAVVSVKVHTGTLPAGLTLSNAGVLSGTPTTPESQTFTVRALDSNGLFADVEDTVAIAVPWLLTFALSAGKSMKRSPDGTDWSSAAFSPTPVDWGSNGVAQFAKHGDSLLLSTVAASPGDYAIFSPDRGATFNDTNIALAADGGEACWSGGYWHIIAGGSQPFRSADGITFAAVGTSPACLTLGTDSSRLVCINGSGWVYVTDNEAGDVWTRVDDLPGGILGGMKMGGRAGRVAVTGGRGVPGPLIQHYLYSTFNGADSWDTHPSPFPTIPVASTENRIRWFEGLGIWVVTFGTRLAYGPSLDALTLAARVFPQQITNLDADNVRVQVCGAAGMLEYSDGDDLETWTQASNMPGTSNAAVIAIGYPAEDA